MGNPPISNSNIFKGWRSGAVNARGGLLIPALEVADWPVPGFDRGHTAG